MLKGRISSRRFWISEQHPVVHVKIRLRVTVDPDGYGEEVAGWPKDLPWERMEVLWNSGMLQGIDAACVNVGFDRKGEFKIDELICPEIDTLSQSELERLGKKLRMMAEEAVDDALTMLQPIWQIPIKRRRKK